MLQLSEPSSVGPRMLEFVINNHEKSRRKICIHKKSVLLCKILSFLQPTNFVILSSFSFYFGCSGNGAGLK